MVFYAILILSNINHWLIMTTSIIGREKFVPKIRLMQEDEVDFVP